MSDDTDPTRSERTANLYRCKAGHVWTTTEDLLIPETGPLCLVCMAVFFRSNFGGVLVNSPQ